MKERILWIDRVKGLAMICVVLCHVVNGFNSAQIYPASGKMMYSIQNTLNLFQMALFCIASGYVFSMVYLDDNMIPAKERIKKQNISYSAYRWSACLFDLIRSFLE